MPVALTGVEQIDNFPGSMTSADLAFDSLLEQMIGDDVYIGAGTLKSTDWTQLIDIVTWDEALAAAFDVLGELAEKPGKIESKLSALRTRNYKVAGKRTTNIEITIIGVSQLQKSYLESTDFSTTTMTMVLRNREKDRVMVFNGMKWAVDWSGEVDGLFTVVLTTEFSGTTDGKIYFLKDIVADATP